MEIRVYRYYNNKYSHSLFLNARCHYDERVCLSDESFKKYGWFWARIVILRPKTLTSLSRKFQLYHTKDLTSKWVFITSIVLQMSIITNTSQKFGFSFTCIAEYVIAFTSVPWGCFWRSNVSPNPIASISIIFSSLLALSSPAFSLVSLVLFLRSNFVISILNGTKKGSALKLNSNSSKKLYNADSISCPRTFIVSDLHSLTVSVRIFGAH